METNNCAKTDTESKAQGAQASNRTTRWQTFKLKDIYGILLLLHWDKNIK